LLPGGLGVVTYSPQRFENASASVVRLATTEMDPTPNALVTATGVALVGFHGQVENGWTRDVCEFLVPGSPYGYPLEVKEFLDGQAIAYPATFWMPAAPTGCGVDEVLVFGVDDNHHILVRALTVLFGKGPAILRLAYQVTAVVNSDETWPGP
jgi:hypothetical protein